MKSKLFFGSYFGFVASHSRRLSRTKCLNWWCDRYLPYLPHNSFKYPPGYLSEVTVVHILKCQQGIVLFTSKRKHKLYEHGANNYGKGVVLINTCAFCIHRTRKFMARIVYDRINNVKWDCRLMCRYECKAIVTDILLAVELLGSLGEGIQ